VVRPESSAASPTELRRARELSPNVAASLGQPNARPLVELGQLDALGRERRHSTDLALNDRENRVGLLDRRVGRRQPADAEHRARSVRVHLQPGADPGRAELHLARLPIHQARVERRRVTLRERSQERGGQETVARRSERCRRPGEQRDPGVALVLVRVRVDAKRAVRLASRRRNRRHLLGPILQLRRGVELVDDRVEPLQKHVLGHAVRQRDDQGEVRAEMVVVAVERVDVLGLHLADRVRRSAGVHPEWMVDAVDARHQRRPEPPCLLVGRHHLLVNRPLLLE